MALSKLAQAEKDILAQDDGLQKANLKSLSYIKFMASRMNIDIKKLDVFSEFAGEGEKSLLTDKREIGKVFLAKVEEVSKNRKAVGLDDMPELVEALRARVVSTLEQRKGTLDRNIRGSLTRVSQYQERVQNELNTLASQRIELCKLQGEEPSEAVLDELQEVLSEGYWINPVFDGGFLYLNTKNHVVIKHTNKQSKVDMTVDLGQIAVKVDLNSFNMWCLPYKNNVRADGHFHPNVSTSGRICWGNGSDRMATWLSELKVGACLKLLFSLLQNYAPDGGPYVSIETFNQQGKKYGRVAAALMHPDKKKKSKITKKVEAEEVTEDRYVPPRAECVCDVQYLSDCNCEDCRRHVLDCGCANCRTSYAERWPDSIPSCWPWPLTFAPAPPLPPQAAPTYTVATSDEGSSGDSSDDNTPF